jgi:hypothetical protein
MDNNQTNAKLAQPRTELLYLNYTKHRSPNTFVQVSYILNRAENIVINMQKGDEELITEKIKALYAGTADCVEKIINDPNDKVEISNMQDGDEELITEKIKTLDKKQVLYVGDAIYVNPDCVEKIINDLNAEVEIVPERLYSYFELEILLKSRGLYSSEILDKAQKNIVKLLRQEIYEGDYGYRKSLEFNQYLGASILDFINKEKAPQRFNLLESLKNAFKLF